MVPWCLKVILPSAPILLNGDQRLFDLPVDALDGSEVKFWNQISATLPDWTITSSLYIWLLD